MDGTVHPAEVRVRRDVVAVNDARFRITRVRGDGDCLFHCFDRIDGMRNGPAFYRKMTDTPRGWGDTRSIRVYSEITNRNVYVVMPGSPRGFGFVEVFKASRRPASEEFLLFRDSHFDHLERVA